MRQVKQEGVEFVACKDSELEKLRMAWHEVAEEESEKEEPKEEDKNEEAQNEEAHGVVDDEDMPDFTTIGGMRGPSAFQTAVAEAALAPILLAQTPYWPSISTSTQL